MNLRNFSLTVLCASDAETAEKNKVFSSDAACVCMSGYNRTPHAYTPNTPKINNLLKHIIDMHSQVGLCVGKNLAMGYTLRYRGYNTIYCDNVSKMI